MKRYGVLMLLWLAGMIGEAAAGISEETLRPGQALQANGSLEAFVQIGGRFCEYRRSEVEGALRRFDAVQQVEFLNQHGTLRVRYLPGAVGADQLADAVERALAMGWQCKAWVDRGRVGGER
jgi:hypothetical protein